MNVTCKTMIGTLLTFTRLVTREPSLVITCALLTLLFRFGKNVYSIYTAKATANCPVCRRRHLTCRPAPRFWH